MHTMSLEIPRDLTFRLIASIGFMLYHDIAVFILVPSFDPGAKSTSSARSDFSFEMC
jgi:hypothetical protein